MVNKIDKARNVNPPPPPFGGIFEQNVGHFVAHKMEWRMDFFLPVSKLVYGWIFSRIPCPIDLQITTYNDSLHPTSLTMISSQARMSALGKILFGMPTQQPCFWIASAKDHMANNPRGKSPWRIFANALVNEQL